MYCGVPERRPGDRELRPGVRDDLLGEPEVRQEDAPAGVDHEVARLHVAVHDALLVGVAERLGGVADQPQDAGQVELGGVDRAAVDELHRDVAARLLLAGVEHRRDRRMVEPPGDLGLADEALAVRLVLGVDHLEGDEAPGRSRPRRGRRAPCRPCRPP
jgi:hypothetical protein